VADLAGQKTQMASLFTAGLILLTVLFLAGLFEDLPQAVLGAIVIDAAIGLIKVPEMQRFMRTSRVDFAAYVAAGVGVFFVGVLYGVVVGVLVSLLLLIAAASRSPARRLGLDARSNVYVDTETYPEAVAPANVLVAGIDGPLFFADVANFKRSILQMATADGVRAVVIDLAAAATIDLDGADALTELHDALVKKNIRVVLARVRHQHIDFLRKAGTLDVLGEDSVHASVRDAVAALEAAETDERSAVDGDVEAGGQAEIW
jgi:MFS superfamily sulfate permease-like transporter